MNTNLLLVTNVPKSLKPFDLINDLENKWARSIFIENPYFDLIDAFIYNPTNLMTHYELGVKKLRDKVINGIKPLKVYHLWFPPPNVYLTNLIPENSTMLPFLFVDNLPKECDSFEVIGDLPFQPNEVKHWDVPQKEDKWMILRLPANQDDAIRDYVLKYIRSRRLTNGLFPRVLEVFATEENRLAMEMIPKKINLLPITASYKSNLIFLYDLPTKMTVRNITETSKTLNVKGAKAFFVDVVNSLRVGFLFIPKSLSEVRFRQFQEQLGEKEIVLDDQIPIFLNINEVWLQPFGAAEPHPMKKEGDDREVEFVLTNYIFVHNVAACIDHNLLTKGSPVTFKVYLFQVSENMTQVGFICLRGMTDEKIVQLVKYLRTLSFEGFEVMVDNIYLKCYDLPENHSERRDVHVPRRAVVIDNEPVSDMVIVIDDGDQDEPPPDEDASAVEVIDITDSKIEISKEPPAEYNLLKSDFIFVNNLPNDVEASLFSYLDIEEKAVTIMSSDDHKAAVMHCPDTAGDVWLSTLESVATSRVKGHFVEVSEVYLQSEERAELLRAPLPALRPSKYLFVYNIGESSDTRQLEEHANIVRFSTMDTESGSCAFVELIEGLSVEETLATLQYVRRIRLAGECLCADLIWLAVVKVHQKVPAASLRTKWLKKPASVAAARKAVPKRPRVE